jgi:DNA-binding XRE family transcriptional regulator
MPKKCLPRILSVEPGEKPFTLLIEWSTKREKTTVDLTDMLKTYHVFAPLKDNLALFMTVQVGEFGTDVVWSESMEISADTLWRLAETTCPSTISANDFQKWRHKHAYTLDDAAKALGISRRMAAYYESGRPIPRVVGLAILALDHYPDAAFKTG